MRNALITPFTVIMLLFPWMLTGVVIVEVMFRYQGFGWRWSTPRSTATSTPDRLLDRLVALVLVTQLVSDVGYAWLNPRIRVH